MGLPSVLFVGSDHAGFSVKEKVREMLAKEYPALKVQDCGCFDENSVDYPDVAKIVGEAVAKDKSHLAILVCGSGIGMSIAANKIAGVRAAEVWDVTSARLCREHNDANAICFGARLIGIEVALDIVRVWLRSEFLGGRHEQRVKKIAALE